jgi:multiple sugar transport system substrate-binding protein
MNDNQNQDGVVFDQNTPQPPAQPPLDDPNTVVINQPMPAPEETPDVITDIPVENASTNPDPTPNSYDTVPEVIPDDVGSGPQQPYEPPPPSDDNPPIYEENKNKFIFIGVGAVIFLLIFGLLLKVILGGKKQVQKVNLTYWGLWEDKGIMDPVIQDYQRKNPTITITYTKMEPQDYRAKILARSREGKGPDIFRYQNTWLPTMTDVVAPLPKNIMTDAEFNKTFYPIHQTDLKIKNYYYGIPMEIDGLVLVYNDELLKRAGLQVAPQTWEEVVSAASKLTVKDKDGKIVTSGLAIGTGTNVDHFSDIFGWMLLQNGGDIKKVSAEEGKGTLELYRKFAEQPDNIWDENMRSSTQAFIHREAAMIIIPSWEISVIKQIDPDIPLKVTVLPILPGGSLLSLANYWVEGVSKYSKNQAEAWKFLKYLSSSEVMTKLYAEESKVRIFGEPYSRVDLGKTLQSDPYLGPIIQQAPTMKSLPVIARTYDDGLNDKIVKYLQDAMNATAQGVSYEEALATAEKGINQIFTDFKIQ